MPDKPDFKRIADVLLARLLEVRSKGMIAEVDTVAEQLRQVWNARGAADLVKLEAELSTLMGSTAAGPYVKEPRPRAQVARPLTDC